MLIEIEPNHNIHNGLIKLTGKERNPSILYLNSNSSLGHVLPNRGQPIVTHLLPILRIRKSKDRGTRANIQLKFRKEAENLQANFIPKFKMTQK